MFKKNDGILYLINEHNYVDILISGSYNNLTASAVRWPGDQLIFIHSIFFKEVPCAVEEE